MGTCYLLRIDGGFMVALPVESISILILSASVLKNVCSCSDNPLLQRIGDQFTRNVEAKIDAVTTTVTIDQAPPSPPVVVTVTTATASPSLPTQTLESEPKASEEKG